MTHGSKYLTENAPAFLRDMLRDDPEEPKASGAPGVSETRGQFFAEKVSPIFQSKCLACHGSEKQKGGYRLDKPEVALRGGKSGKTAIVPKNPLESNLVRLMLLPCDDDEAMPPDGKEPLKAEEMALILEWIRLGAEFPVHKEPVRSVVKAL